MDDDEFEEIPAPSHDQEPSEEEIIEYFKWLGGNPDTDRSLMWIARNALREPLPEGWKLYRKKNDNNDPFYFNTQTGESLWDHPKDNEYKELFQQEKLKIDRGLESIPRPLPSLGNYQNASSQLFDIEDSDTHTEASDLNSSQNSNGVMDRDISLKRRDFNSELQQLISEHNENIEREKARYEKTLSNLRTKYEKEISDEEEKQKKRVEDIKNKHQKEIDELMKKNNQKKDQIKSESQSDEINQMKEDFEDEMEKLKDSFNTEKLEAIKKHQDEMAEIQQKQKSTEKQKEKLEKIENDFEEQKQQLIESNNEEIEDITKRHQQNIEKLKKKQQREIQELKENFDPDQQIEELKMSLKKKQREIQAKFDKEIEELKNQHEAEVDEIQNSNSNKINLGLHSILGTQYNTDTISNDDQLFQKQMEDLKQEQEKEIAKQKKKHQKILDQNEEKFQHDLELAKTKQETERLREETQLRRDYEAKKVELENQLKEDMESEKQLKIEQLKRQLEKEVEASRERQMIDLRNSSDQKKKEMMSKFQDEQMDLRKSQEKELSKIKKQHQKLLEDEDIKFNHDMEIKKTKHETERMKIEDQYRREIDQLRAAHIEKKKREEYEKQSLHNNPYLQDQARNPYQQQQENIIDFDEKTMSKFKKLQYKMEKIKSQFDTSYGNFPVSLKELLNDINNVCQGYKSLITEQNRTMTKMVSDFQQQTSQLARQFQTSLSDVESSYRAALNAYANGGVMTTMGGQFQLQSPPIIQTEYARPSSSRRRYQNSDDSDEDYPSNKKVKVVYQGQRRYKKYHDDYE